jgi:hypothetical protein
MTCCFGAADATDHSGCAVLAVSADRSTLIPGWNWLPYLHLRDFRPALQCANVLSTTSELFSTDWGLLFGFRL